MGLDTHMEQHDSSVHALNAACYSGMHEERLIMLACRVLRHRLRQSSLLVSHCSQAYCQTQESGHAARLLQAPHHT